MTLFKLIFEHDMVLDAENPAKHKKEPSTLDDFLKPAKTYSRFYFSATDMNSMKFGLDVVPQSNLLFQAFKTGLGESRFMLSDGSSDEDMQSALDKTPFGGAIVVLKNENVVSTFPKFSGNDNPDEKIAELTRILDLDHLVLFKIPSPNGIDLQLYSKKNIYRDFFYQFKPLINNTLRFFSINGKRLKNQRFLYFETWSLDKPPHGFEEVFEDTAFY
ncbi:MAG TPA: hypothetical protein DCE78_01110 [Bacteroidetes bacterium]|nr:hypothetical protein [Bacteroidota bacterium]